jgi:hypothetical protein
MTQQQRRNSRKFPLHSRILYHHHHHSRNINYDSIHSRDPPSTRSMRQRREISEAYFRAIFMDTYFCCVLLVSEYILYIDWIHRK